jgi:hypothetical protein
MNEVYEIYNQFIAIFPKGVQWLVSLVLAAFLVLAVYKVLKRNFIYLILLIVLLPASIPILRHVWESLVQLIKFLLTKR